MGIDRMTDSFRASDISLKVQKKLLSKMSTKSIAKTLVDENFANILDNLYRLVKAYTGSKKDAETIIKDVIKIVIKINLLARNDQFTSDELNIALKIHNKFAVVIKTIISFFEVEFSFDKNFLKKNLAECQSMIIHLVENHLTDKSLGRIDKVFNFYKQDAFLEEMFRRESPHRPLLQTIIDDMNKAIDSGEL